VALLLSIKKRQGKNQDEKHPDEGIVEIKVAGLELADRFCKFADSSGQWTEESRPEDGRDFLIEDEALDEIGTVIVFALQVVRGAIDESIERT
jgi:hypothetical protein